MLRSDPRIHYKMYKAKKNMVYATLFSFAVLGGLGLSQNAEADTVKNTNTAPTVQTTVNSAQPTTGATPQSMPTQSAMPTQSPAADVNAVNSAPTSQPTSAQPVVNSQANSASNVSNQTPTNTLNVQPVHPAQKFAATNQASLYTQNLTVRTSQPAVENATFKLYNANSSQEATVVAGDDVALGLQGSFTIDSSAFGPNKPNIKLGTLAQTSSPSSNKQIFNQFDFDSVSLRYNGKVIGYLTIPDNQTIYVRPTAESGATGKINLSFNIPRAILMDHNSPASQIEGLGFPQSHTLAIGNSSFTLHFTEPQYQPEKFDSSNWYYDSEWTNDNSASPATVIKSSAHFQWIPRSILNQLDNSDGQANVQLPTSYQYGMHIVTDASLLGIRNPHGAGALPINPQTYKMMTSNAGEPQLYWKNSNVITVADNLSLDQLKTLNHEGTAVSRQSDGSYNVWTNWSADDLRATDADWNGFAKGTYYNVINGANPEQNAAAMKHFYQDGTLKGLPTSVNNEIDLDLADPTVQAHATIEYFNRDEKSIGTSRVTSTPAQLMASGQAAVKLHVINATNGTELNQWRKLISEARNKKSSSQ